MSRDSRFEPNLNKMFYYVREPVIDYNFKEGFANKIKLYSELCDGQICIDGANKYHCTYGDTCEIDIRPEFRLKSFRFVEKL